MKQGNGLSGWTRKLTLAVLLTVSVCGWAQNSAAGASSSANDSTVAAIHQLQQQVSELRSAMEQMRAQAEQSRAENTELRRELQEVRQQVASSDPPGVSDRAASAASANGYGNDGARPAPGAQADSLAGRVASLEESTQLLNSKVNDQYQTKVESASKYRVRLSGLILLNLFSNRGMTDNLDLPTFASGPDVGHETFGATLRQSEIGLEVFGPTVAGARISGSLQADFAGGFASTWNGVDSGIFRLQTADVRLDWSHTSIVGGQDSLFISPLSPTSFATLAVPAFNYAGNLWAWTPQLRVEHRFDLADNQSITVQGGVFDNLVGEFPSDPYFRSAGPGEASGQPAYGFRTAWSRNVLGQGLSLGAAGYYGRQEWQYGRTVDSWAGMADWQIPLTRRLALSGEFYRGRAIGGIGAGDGRSVVYNGMPGDSYTQITPLDAIGGWSQLKLRATSKLEFNAGFGLDNPRTSELRAGAASETYVGPSLAQNRSALGNVIFRPRSNLLFSGEYRYLRTFVLDSGNQNAEQVNVMMGILF